ncbi:MAG TPA: hypothetical protein DDY13_03245 [Cytophagales bacterium]|jgi:hypothetical protein|nr:hypothetical protein [Cytophagales bacterium]
MKYIDYRVGHIIPPFSLQYYYKNAVKAPYWEMDKQEKLVKATQYLIRQFFGLAPNRNISFISGQEVFYNHDIHWQSAVNFENACFKLPKDHNIILNKALFQKGFDFNDFEKNIIIEANELGLPHELYIYIGEDTKWSNHWTYNLSDIVTIHLIKDILSEWSVKGYGAIQNELVYKKMLWHAYDIKTPENTNPATQIIKLNSDRAEQIAKGLESQRVLVSYMNNSIMMVNTPAHSKEQMEHLFDLVSPLLNH